MSAQFDSDNHYEVLGLQPGCSEVELKKAYRRLAMEHHPDKVRDKNSSDYIFKRIREAYEVLSNPKTRSKYDEQGKLNESYNDFVEKNKNVFDEETLENAFNQLIKGKYPSISAKRNKKVGVFDEVNRDLPERTFDEKKPKKSNDTISF